MTQTTPLLGLCAYSGTGKTSLLEQLLPLLQPHLRVAVLKHTHHHFDMDKPGKDSYRLRAAGANPMLLASSQRWVLMQETPEQTEADFKGLTDALSAYAGSTLDLIIVEGFRHEVFPKIELHRPVLQQPLLCVQDTSIIAVATDAPLVIERNLPVLDLNHPPHIAEFILHWYHTQ